MAETRKLAAILAADVAGYSKLAGADEERTLARLRALRSDLIDPSIALHHGRVVKRTGDGVLLEFRSVVDAVRCAIEVQTGMIERNAGLPSEHRIEFRVGIHLGDVVEESDGDLMGNDRRASCITLASACGLPPGLPLRPLRKPPLPVGLAIVAPLELDLKLGSTNHSHMIS
jgi:class 3 adenylate cyclase